MSNRRIPKALFAAALGIIASFPLAQKTAEAQTNPPPSHDRAIVTDGGCGGFEAWPDVKRLDNGELLVAFYAGYAHGSPPTDQLPHSGKMALVRSEDNDEERPTWTFPLCPQPPQWSLDWQAMVAEFAWIRAMAGCPQ